MSSKVYFAQAGHDGPIKIGFTTDDDPISRILSLQTGCPWPITLIGARDGDQLHERWLHRRFSAARMQGEWFAYSTDLSEFIAEVLSPSFAWPDLIRRPCRANRTAQPSTTGALQRACDLAGGQEHLATLVGTTQSQIWYWLERSKKGVPAEFVIPIESATGVARHELRPDLYPLRESARAAG